ncbi:hypothetical protein KR026_004840 [Drosophila bipectinata]|nr:hypothetical protein KR026_004840 [Drosophila bipectinata]
MERSTVTAKNTVRRTSRTTRRKRAVQGRSSAGQQEEIEEETTGENQEGAEATKQKIQQRVFLYIQLNELTKLPETGYPLELHLYHSKHTLQKMQEKYTTETIIYQHEFNLQKPVFAMGVLQDDIEDMNIFSDSPLVISLYQRIPAHRKGDSETMKSRSGTETSEANEATGPKKTRRSRTSKKSSDSVLGEILEGDMEGDYGWVPERLELLSRGHCDLLQLFQRRRFISDVTVLLYPEYDSLLQARGNQKITSCSIWHMYSILPILKEFNFTNLAFLTLESIYNVPEELHHKSAELGIQLSFRSRYPEGEEGIFPVIPLCTYFGFLSQIISDQNTSIVWENIKRDLNPNTNFSSNQMETNSRIKLPRIFRMLLWEKDVNFRLHLIDPVTDLALINNSLHRFVINEDMRKILEEAVVHNDYELLVQFYQEVPENVLYEGVINPSIFGYPGVNYCRFATLLKPILENPEEATESPRTTWQIGPMFCTLKICFFQPLCQRNEPLDKFNESLLKRAKLRRCFDIEFLNENEEEENRNVLLELYRAFDELISDMISFIIKREVESIDQKRDFFCCQLGNLSNLLLKICGCDFNVRMPTSTNIEFREMLTHMYQELMERVEGILNNCSWQCCDNNLEQEYDQLNLVRLMDEMRMVSQIGLRDMAIQMYGEIKNQTTSQINFDYVTLLNSVENLQFAQAARYFQKPRSSEWSGVYFTQLLQVYVDYMMDLRSTDEEVQAVSYSNLLDNLRQLATKNSLEVEPWILLYCYYKLNNYLPGMEYTRWKFENLYEIPGKIFSFTPRSLYELYMPVDFAMSSSSTTMNVHFYPVFKLFARLGAYVFAETVFAEIETCFSPSEVYLIKTTLKILQRQIDETFTILNIPTTNAVTAPLMRCYQLHINGNVEYARGRCDEALQYFQQLLAITEADDRLLFKLSFMRLGQLAFERGNYELANEAFDICVPSNRKHRSFIANYSKGLTLYHLNRLQDSISYLSRCTEMEIFIPDVWGYLATINLKLQLNKRALDCWKMAKMYPELFISKSVYAELDKIKYSDVHLLVDNDGNPAEKPTQISTMCL